MTTLTFDNLKIEKSSNNSYYITIDDWVIYLDDSIQGEKIITHWIEDHNISTDKIKNSTLTY
jgi:hypothetical protein